MNLNGVTKLYHRLTPAERVAAITAALVRSDHAEAERLSAAAPLEAGQMPSHTRLGIALAFVAAQHREILLDLTAKHWRAIATAADRTDPAAVERCYQIAWEMASEFVVEERVFAHVCDHFGVDPADLLACHSTCGSTMLDEMREFAAAITSKPEAARKWLPNAEPMTVAELAEPMLQFVATATA